MRDMRDALIWDGVGRALSRGSWDYWRTGTVGDTGTGHRRGAKRGHRVLQGCWKRSIGPDVELSMQLVADWGMTGGGKDVGVSSDHVGGSGLHNLAADNSVVGVLLDHRGVSGVGLVGLTSDD